MSPSASAPSCGRWGLHTSVVPSNVKSFDSTRGATNSATTNHKALRTEEEGDGLC